MTLTISLVTPDTLYQSSDFCLTDPITGEPIIDRGHKSAHVTHFDWAALVAFAGIARTTQVDVSTWLGDQILSLSREATVATLISRLSAAGEWLRPLPLEHRAITFSVLAFERGQPSLTIVTNVDRLSGIHDPMPSRDLRVETTRPSRPKVFVTGYVNPFPRQGRRQLEHLSGKSPDRVSRALAEVNARASDALLGKFVSRSCAVSYLERSGRGVTVPFGIDEEQTDFVPIELEAALRSRGVKLTHKLDEHGNPLPIKMVQMATQRTGETMLNLMELQAGIEEP
ncbi:MAG: hypothetical protein HY263_02680, partial [Chloroflexi bacterium]|nr:hypothetical protein [Chloroflexota bacterium]